MREAPGDELFRLICEAAPDGIVVVDRDGCIVFTNVQAQKLFGFTGNELAGMRVEQLVPAPAREAHTSLRAGYNEHPATRPMGGGRKLLGQRKDGSEFPVEISLSPVESGGDVRIIAIVRDISDRQRLEAEREHLRVIADREQERQRIAMNLHDGVIQSIYAAALNLELAADDVKANPDDAVTGINKAIDQLNDTIRDLRVYILDLRPARYGGDLAASLESLLTEFRANTLIEVVADIPAGLPKLVEEQEAAVFHLVQEALNNTRKHSRATELMLSLRAGDGVFELDIMDNGVGFDPGLPIDDSHHGMRNMLARATAHGGMLRVETAPGAGTRVHVEMPLQDEEGAK